MDHRHVEVIFTKMEGSVSPKLGYNLLEINSLSQFTQLFFELESTVKKNKLINLSTIGSHIGRRSDKNQFKK